MIIYDGLWDVMKKRGISQYALIKHYGISPGQLTRLKRNESVSTHTIDMFCRILDCQVGDIMRYLDEGAKKPPDGLQSGGGSGMMEGQSNSPETAQGGYENGTQERGHGPA